MFFSNIECGDRIEIKNIKSDAYNPGEGNLSDETYISEVYDTFDDNTMEITMPISEARLIPLSLERKYTLYFLTQKGIYTAMGTVIKRYKRGSIYLLKVELQGEITKVQRREYFRMPASMDIEFLILKDDQEKKLEGLENFKNDFNECGVTKDVSGGGIKFLAGVEIKKGSEVFARIDLSDSDEKNERRVIKHLEPLKEKDVEGGTFIYSVIKVIECFLNDNGYYECRGLFTDIDKKEREKLIKHLFILDRRSRRKD